MSESFLQSVQSRGLITLLSDFLAGRSHEERTKELEIGKRAMYAVPFRGATVAMEAVPRRGVYGVVYIGKGRKKKEVKMWRNARRYAPCRAEAV
ncbi:hypothetical protein CW713_07520 [Methanophagales archaeon]|nr:MAG: hypothetical protein CW713_07520 [Methanophagales archaeon]